MDLGSLFLRAAITDNGDVYLPYGFEGKWTEKEKNTIRKAIDPHVPEKVDSMFNNWAFIKGAKDHFMGKRATWEIIWSVYTVDELASKITEYYNR